MLEEARELGVPVGHVHASVVGVGQRRDHLAQCEQGFVDENTLLLQLARRGARLRRPLVPGEVNQAQLAGERKDKGCFYSLDERPYAIVRIY